ncbi:hypothetical protein ACJ72_05294 [Emergomyces africanus]|uniref:Uncharacterized protein n=1 Tax=Emergomyces africanus TaxID=1955775 RepID=A0A1B7NUC2_9EURO|nr:hypothetical protein ACJ72_05294 [Emergomyces africanus]
MYDVTMDSKFFFFVSSSALSTVLLFFPPVPHSNYRPVSDKGVRYVAEENIEPISPEISQLPPAFVKMAGKHFKRWDPEARIFVSNIRDEYPDD